jgi:hypothetical protein
VRVELHQVRSGFDENAMLNTALRLMPDALEELGLAAAANLPDSMRLGGSGSIDSGNTGLGEGERE